MTTTDISSYNALEDAVVGLGFPSVYEYAKNHVQSALREKIAYYQGRIDLYEEKYRMNFQEFRLRVVNADDKFLSNFGIFEKEDDDFGWDDAIDFVQLYSQKLQQTLP